MSLFDIFKRKKAAYSFSDEDRKLSEELRKQNADFKRLKQEHEIELLRLKHERETLRLEEEIDNLKDKLGYFDEDEDEPRQSDSLTSLLAPFILKMIQSRTNSSQAGGVVDTSQPPSPPAKRSLTPEEITNIVRAVPRNVLKMSKKMSDEQVKLFIQNQLPQIDEDSIQRILLTVRQTT